MAGEKDDNCRTKAFGCCFAEITIFGSEKSGVGVARKEITKKVIIKKQDKSAPKTHVVKKDSAIVRFQKRIGKKTIKGASSQVRYRKIKLKKTKNNEEDDDDKTDYPGPRTK